MDLDSIPPFVWGGAGAGSMFSLLFWLLATGRMYTRSQHQEIVEPLRERIADQKAQLEQAIETNDRLTTAVQNLVVPAHTSATALRAIARTAGANPDGQPHPMDGDE